MARGKFEYWLNGDGPILLEGWARDGLTDEQIAHNMGVALSTLKVWKDKFPAISASLKKGKEIADYEVENALFKRAVGYTETETRMSKDGELVQVEKVVPPDVTAQIFWLKNRRPANWRDKPTVDANAELISKVDAMIEELRNATKQDADGVLPEWE